MKNISCDCIIPYYNEGARPIHVIEDLLKVEGLSRIIAVDDGSADRTTYRELKKRFPNITAIRLEQNTGKPHAVSEGLKFSKSLFCLLLDGDLTNIKAVELENAIQKITSNLQIDMIILRRSADSTAPAWTRQDIVTSGQRILRKADLEQIFHNYPSGYQLEWAINTYMIRNRKKVYWMPFSIHNKWRHEKYGFIAGIKTYLTATQANLRVGVHNLLWQTLFFCRDEAP